jgi:hypothetical protein
MAAAVGTTFLRVDGRRVANDDDCDEALALTAEAA